MTDPPPFQGSIPPVGQPPHEVNVGIDLEEVERFRSGLGDSALRDLFTAAEIEYCAGFDDRAARFAGTWCAKEAAVKALWPWARLEPRRIEVSRAEDGMPRLLVSGWSLAEAGVAVRVSISHSRSIASACAIAWGPRPAAAP